MLGDEFKPRQEYDNKGRALAPWGQQCDAREFFEEVFKALAQAEFPRIPAAASSLLRESVIDEHLIGRVDRQRVICRTCNRASDCFEWERFLRLYPGQHAPRSGVISLEDLIARQIGEVEMSEKRCEECGGDENRPHEKHYFPVRDPAVLVFVLSRCSQDYQVQTRDQTRVCFPREIGGVASRPRRYRFAGAVCHESLLGRADGGHYVAVCDVGEDMYKRFDDDKVSRARTWAQLSRDDCEGRRLQKDAYILVYVSQGEPAAPGGDARARPGGGDGAAGSSSGADGSGPSGSVGGQGAPRGAGGKRGAADGRPDGKRHRADSEPTRAGAASSSAAAAAAPVPSGQKRKASPAAADAGGAVDEQEIWRRFTPSTIDQSKCMARTWAAGRGGQCPKAQKHGLFCEAHAKMLGEYEEGQGKGWHGALDGPVPPKKLEEFMKRAAAAGVAQGKEPAPSDSEVRPAPAPQAAEPRHVGSDGSGGAPPAR